MAHFQKDGLWIQGGKGQLAQVNETTPFIAGQLGRVMSIRADSGTINSQADVKLPRFYQYVQRYTTDAVTPIPASLCYWRDLDDFIVTADSSLSLGGTTYPGPLAGVFLGVSATGSTGTAYPAAGKYGFVQVGGPAEMVVTGTIVVGQRLNLTAADTYAAGDVGAYTVTIDSSTGTSVAISAVPTFVGYALDAVATSTDSAITVLLDVIRNGW